MYRPFWILSIPTLLILAGCPDPEPKPKDDTGGETDSSPDTDADTDTDTDADGDADADTDTDADTDADADDITIRAIQTGEIPTGADVTLPGVVVVGPQVLEGFHVADPAGRPSWNGLWIEVGALEGVEVGEGDRVTVTGRVAERASSATKPPAGDGALTLIEAAEVVVDGRASVPAPVRVELSVLLDPREAEPYEGMLLRLDAPVVETGGEGEWTLEGGLWVSNLYHVSTTRDRSTFETLAGILYFEDGLFKLEPRDATDLVGYVPGCAADLCVEDLHEGDLVVTEIMQNPSSVLGSDYNGEWFEIRNATGLRVDLEGLTLHDLGSDAFVVPAGYVLEGEDFFVFCPNGDLSTNGGLGVDYVYRYADMALGNRSDEVCLDDDESADDGFIDCVAYDGGASEGGVFPDPNGASMTLSPGAMDAWSNDDGLNWCEATSIYGSGSERGTPGATNDACP
jgi:hypothetical protein